MAQWVKDVALSLQWCGFDSWLLELRHDVGAAKKENIIRKIFFFLVLNLQKLGMYFTLRTQLKFELATFQVLRSHRWLVAICFVPTDSGAKARNA